MTLILLFLATFIGRTIAIGNQNVGIQQACLLAWPQCSNCNQKQSLKIFTPNIVLSLFLPKCSRCQVQIKLQSLAPECLSVLIVFVCLNLLPSHLIIWGCILGLGLLFLAITDWYHFTLPNIIIYSLIPIGLLFAYLNHTEHFIHYIIGTAVGFLGFMLIRLIYRMMRQKEGMGMGDAKLMAVAGAWGAWWSIPWITLIGSLVALLAILILPKFRSQLNANLKIPFGTFLSFAIGIVFLMQMSHKLPDLYWM